MAVFSWIVGVGTAMAATTPSQFLVVDVQLVSKTPVAGSSTGQHDYVYRLQIRNAGADVLGAQGVATSRRSSVVATDAEVSFPAIKARQLAVSGDTFTLRAGQFFDRRLDPKSIRNGRMTYDVPGTDPDDARAGFAPLMLDLGDVVINTWYVTKLNAVLAWQLQPVTDVTAPVISATLPVGNVASARPVISASYADAGGAVNPASAVLSVDGQVVTGAAVTATGIRYVPTADLAQGAHTVGLKVRDTAGNEASATWSFSVLTSGPALTLTTPAEGEVLAADALPTLSGQWTATPAGIDPSSLSVRLDGQPVTAQISGNGFSATVAAALTEGAHTWTVTLKDPSGNVSSRTGSFITRSAPVVTHKTPWDIFLPAGATPTIRATYTDIGAGIDASNVRLLFNGTDVTAQSSVSDSAIVYMVPTALPDASHQLRLTVVDRAGNETIDEWRFGTAQAPVVTVVSPLEKVLPAGSRPTIAADFVDTRQGIDRASIYLSLNDEDVTAKATITDTGIRYTPAQPLPEGPYTVLLQVANRANAATSQTWGFEVQPVTRYEVSIVSPGAQSVTEPVVQVTAQASSNRTKPVSMTVAGRPMELSSEVIESGLRFTLPVDLVDGINTLQVVATFEDGETRSASVQVSYDAPARITITSPADKAMLGRALSSSPIDLTGNVERPVDITGRLSKPVQSVTVNQQQAVLNSNGTEFSFPRFFLREGTNMITVVAVDLKGRTSSAAITVSVDQTAPILSIEAPLNGSVTSAAKVDVRGIVNDAVEGFTGAPEPIVSVWVNGAEPAGVKPAQVADRYFVLADVPLVVGENVVIVTARDQFGNARSQEIRINRIAVGSSRLTPVGGNHQRGPIDTQLPKPLSVVALNAAGEPVANLPVKFDVTRGTGSISLTEAVDTTSNGATPSRNLTVQTDAFGRAQVWFKLGKVAGPGANVVQASHPSLVEPVTFVATSERGAVALVNADLGIHQFGQTGAQPLELMSVVVRDRSDNVLPGVQVVFSVEEGDAYFADTPGAIARDNGRRIVMTTDKNGLTAVRPWIGTQPGLVRVVARAVMREGGNPDVPADLTGEASFQVQAKQAVDGPANFAGYVYTDKGQPLPGVRVSIARTALSSTTDDNGAFELRDVPAGRVDLFIDGRTVNPTNDPSRQQWPSLHFEAYVVKGQDNQLPHPVYLPPLLTSEAKVVGGNQDVILKIPGIEGFQMKVKANSVTFPDGSHVGTLVVSPVTADRLPMAPPAGGATFGIPAWTIQPAGTRFDPPIEVTLPNASAKPAGDNLPIVQWDHDLGQYVPMGRATVSEDGAVMVTDAGSGITKAGWGGLCQYDPDKCATPKCQECQKANPGGNGPCCVFDATAGGPWPPITRGLGFNPKGWGPSGLLEVLLKEVLGVDGRVDVQIKVESSTEGACCEVRQKKREKHTAQLAFGVEGMVDAEILKASPPGRILDTFGVNAFIRLKVGGQGAGTFADDHCPLDYDSTVQYGLTGQVSAAGEVGLRFKPPGTGSGTPTVAVEGFGGIEAAGKILSNTTPNRPIFDIESTLTFYLQLDVILGNGSITVAKRNFELTKRSTADVRPFLPN
ncbi:hypothetical protein [Roseateles amylovorans]|uniref:Uncharacterized protein n=1 Tax=Roseateles amylovorans TaxID=2978473 RepID=A0ABY6AUD6_9BURK|nr:hypothetical protein [Roseateles amylovorans]UXH76185.1 hypothetical protein N4261_14005 [Roseateles amylovorans]